MKSPRMSFLKVAALITACAASMSCQSPSPIVYSGISSSSRLAPNPDNKSGRIPYIYTKNPDWKNYSKIIIDKVEIYRGSDHQFGNLSERKKELLARYMDSQLNQKLSARLKIVKQSQANALRVQVTLTGAKENTFLVSTFTRFDLLGGPFNVVQSIRNREGAFTGAVYYNVEIREAQSNELLASYISKQYPFPLNLAATLGPLSAAKAGISRGVNDLADELK